MAATGRSRSLATMSNSATTHPPASRRVRAAVRREPPRPVIVEDYVGQPAARAVQAVRRAGLRPALERHFGCEGHLSGLTVAQAPPPGAQIARNGNITLYVAAPAADAEQHPQQADREGSPARQAARETAAASVTPHAPAHRRRRRKPGLAERSGAQNFEQAPEPILSATDTRLWQHSSQPDRQAAQPNGEPHLAPAQSWAAETVEVRAGAEHEPRDETLLAEELFAAGGERAAWAAAYTPSVTWRTWRAAAGGRRRRPVLGASVCAMLAVSVALALAGSPASPRAIGTAGTAPAPIGIPDGTLPAGGRTPTHPQRSLMDPAKDVSRAARRTPRARPAQITPASVAAVAGSEQRATPLPAAGGQPHRSPAETAAPAGGGPFSP